MLPAKLRGHYSPQSHSRFIEQFPWDNTVGHRSPAASEGLTTHGAIFAVGFRTVVSVNSQLDQSRAKSAGVKTQNSRGSVRSFYPPGAVLVDAQDILPLHLFTRPGSRRAYLLCGFH